MKRNDLLMFGALGALGYFLYKSQGAAASTGAFNGGAAGVGYSDVTPTPTATPYGIAIPTMQAVVNPIPYTLTQSLMNIQALKSSVGRELTAGEYIKEFDKNPSLTLAEQKAILAATNVQVAKQETMTLAEQQKNIQTVTAANSNFTKLREGVYQQVTYDSQGRKSVRVVKTKK